MTFYTFVTRNCENSPLMSVMKKDRERFPKNGKCKLKGWNRLIREHIVRHPDLYTAELVAEFDSRWEEYLSCVKR